MTCQWCIHYRRRSGISMCLDPINNGNVIAGGTKGSACGRFSARKICTTCEHRCGRDEKDRNMSMPGGCPKWEVRKLSTWGGNRYRNHSK